MNELAELLARIDALEQANPERHAELLRLVARAEDAAQCASLDATEARQAVQRATGVYALPQDDD